tara:strand:+ start:833 stop:1564 length:732 start_codon:yes stop_codon:yes gene_type:complete
MRSDINKIPTIRLNKFISNSGLCSRREADKFIEMGAVKVNGKIITKMGFQVKLSDDVRFDNRKISINKLKYLVLNKPKGFIAPVKKGKYIKNVFELINGSETMNIQCAISMDRKSIGLLLFTNDQNLLDKFKKDSKNLNIIIKVVLDKTLSKLHIEKIKKNFKIKNNKISIKEISYIKGESKNNIGVETYIQSYSSINLIFKKLGYQVLQNDVVGFANLTKKNLPRGKWRELNEKEISLLKIL